MPILLFYAIPNKKIQNFLIPQIRIERAKKRKNREKLKILFISEELGYLKSVSPMHPQPMIPLPQYLLHHSEAANGQTPMPRKAELRAFEFKNKLWLILFDQQHSLGLLRTSCWWRGGLKKFRIWPLTQEAQGQEWWERREYETTQCSTQVLVKSWVPARARMGV